MPHATLKMNGRKFVLVPEKEFRRLSAEDRHDGMLAKRALARWRKGQLKTMSHAQVKQRYGL